MEEYPSDSNSDGFGEPRILANEARLFQPLGLYATNLALFSRFQPCESAIVTENSGSIIGPSKHTHCGCTSSLAIRDC
jgi:hypothetical protein